ncbi:MAG TPA: transcription elongation factor GreA [Bauldia sp.]|nr:transcription elongation factor GreA [Bauldia sp.]
MSRAFVKDAEDDGGDDLPDRPISPHPNYVTARGMAQIDGELARLTAALAATPADDRAANNSLHRDLRYWRARRATAEVIEPPPETGKVHFGSTVTIRRKDGRTQTWQIVGEDEADPDKGTIPYVAPLAKALMGKEVGDEVRAGETAAEILSIK